MTHDKIVRAQFDLQARDFAKALHANDPVLLDQYIAAIAPQSDWLIADLCSGPGIVAERLLGLCRRVICLELSPGMIREARNRFACSKLPGHFSWARAWQVECHVGRAPMRSSSVDVAISRLAFHHIESVDGVFKEMNRITRPGGRIVINDIVTSSIRLESQRTEKIERLRDPSHVRCLSSEEVRALYLNHGVTLASFHHYESVLDHDEWMGRVYPPEENRPVVRKLLEDMAIEHGGCGNPGNPGNDLGGMKVSYAQDHPVREKDRLMIAHRGVIAIGIKPEC